jgi:septal ring factor EnvC (AmiA/AmiB activator)
MLEAARTELEVERGRLLELKSELDRERDKIEAAKRQKTVLLMQVHRRKELYLSMIESREESRQRLIEEVIIEPRAKADPAPPPPAARGEAPRKWPDFEKLKGKIPRPVPGEITGKFGRAPGPFNTVTQRHGLVFSTPAGLPVRSVLAGEVLYTGWVKGYGTIVIVDHGNRYYTLIGGLAGIKPEVGRWVSEGEVLGLAPKGGKKDKKEIYFEIRHRGQAVDPAPWLGKNPVSQG